MAGTREGAGRRPGAPVDVDGQGSVVRAAWHPGAAGGVDRREWSAGNGERATAPQDGGSPAAGGQKVDGRRARGWRTRDAIVAALLDLIAEGDISPTAQRIADHARVSVRSVYQHFVDVQGLYTHGTEKAYAWARQVWAEPDQAQPVDRRLATFVTERTALLESLLPFHRAERLMEPGCEGVREHREAMDRWYKDRIGRIFAPELRSVDATMRPVLHCALDVLSSPECWEHLRNSGQSPQAARQVVMAALRALLDRGSPARAAD
ncbi:MAG: TetR/AcrR family transcriptional regulator [Acidimicrobiales bacterium]